MSRAQYAAQAEEPVSWANRGPYERVGTYRSLRVPASVVKAARQEIGGEPSHWEAYQLTNYGHLHKCVAFLNSNLPNDRYQSSDEALATYLVTSNAWHKLNTPQGISYINDILCRELKLADLKDEKKVSHYLDVLFYLQCPQGAILDEQFLLQLANPERGALWLGTERHLEALRALCHNPFIIFKGTDITISYNVLLYPGEVEQWTLHAKASKYLDLTGIDRIQIRRRGTFSYPLIN